jgi:hypothetical protein
MKQIFHSFISQHLSHVFHDPIVGYMEDLISSSLHPLVNCESEKRDDEDLILQSTMFSCSEYFYL